MQTITVSEAAKIKDCTRKTIYRWIETGRVNTTTDGKKSKIIVDDKFAECQVQLADSHLEKGEMMHSHIEKNFPLFKLLFSFLGFALTGLGIVLILHNFNFLHKLALPKLWPLAMIILGTSLAIFQAGTRVNLYIRYSCLFAAVITILLAAYFLWLNYAGWGNVVYTWPTFILVPGLGLFTLSFLADKHQKRGERIVFLVLSALSIAGAAIFYDLITFHSRIILPALLIISGVLFLLSTLWLPGKKCSETRSQ